MSRIENITLATKWRMGKTGQGVDGSGGAALCEVPQPSKREDRGWSVDFITYSSRDGGKWTNNKTFRKQCPQDMAIDWKGVHQECLPGSALSRVDRPFSIYGSSSILGSQQPVCMKFPCKGHES